MQRQFQPGQAAGPDTCQGLRQALPGGLPVPVFRGSESAAKCERSPCGSRSRACLDVPRSCPPRSPRTARGHRLRGRGTGGGTKQGPGRRFGCSVGRLHVVLLHPEGALERGAGGAAALLQLNAPVGAAAASLAAGPHTSAPFTIAGYKCGGAAGGARLSWGLAAVLVARAQGWAGWWRGQHHL